jgi:hypothetical protein
MAAKSMCWSDELRMKYSELKALEKKPKEAFRAWNSTTGTSSSRRGPSEKGATGDEYMQMIKRGQQGR